MLNMNRWLQLIVFGTGLGIVKSASFVKLVVLAGLGLAGLWMVHTLAQDFSHIVQSGFGSGGAGGGGGGGGDRNGDQELKVFKRSIVDASELKNAYIDWEIVIKRDPASCARSFICQLAASKEDDLTYEEKTILTLVSAAASNQTWASKQLQEALRYGDSMEYPRQCMKLYNFCPYTKRMMMALLRLFGNR